MPDSTLPADLRRFIVARIPSVPILEALLLLRSRASGWAIAELATRLYVSEAHARTLLDELERQGMAQCDDACARYDPRPGEAPLLDELATAYARSLVEVTQLIHSTTEHKAKRFADAFVLRKEPR